VDDFEDGDDFDCSGPYNFLVGTVRVRVRSRDTKRPVEGVLVRIADSHEAILGKR
jgi:hypothetical protein